MSYEHRALKATCGNCGRQRAWLATGFQQLPRSWTCKCGATNTHRIPEQRPPVPPYLYIGADRIERFKVYPIPPEHAYADWAQPYSVRSFVAQASAAYGRCFFSCGKRGTVLGEPAFVDTCAVWESEEATQATTTTCHMVSGWTTGQTACPLWDVVAGLCQTDSERQFLHAYLRFVKDRPFPMLIPQPRIGIAERRRPDFVVFVPLQCWNYKWIAIELDGAHGSEQEARDAERDIELSANGYEVFSVRPAERGYFEEVRRFVERVEEWMGIAREDTWRVAIEAKVIEHELPELPF